MRYARFRTSIDNQIRTKAAAAASASVKNADKAEDDKDVLQQALSRAASKSKTKEKEYKPRQSKSNASSVKRFRDTDGSDGFSDIKDIIVKKNDTASDEKENKANVLFLDPDLFLDGALPDTASPDKANKLKLKSKDLDPRLQDSKTTDVTTEDLLSNTSFTSSLPSPPSEAVPSMESIAHQERKKKMRKMYSFSPTMKPGTLHQIPLPRGAVPSAHMASTSRIHSLPKLSTPAASASSATTPVNLSGVLMMRHHSAGSMSDMGPHHQQQLQQQQQMLRQTRLMTPCSDTDLHHHPHHHHQYFAHHTQIPLMTDPAVVGGLDPTFDFGLPNNNSNGAGAAAGGSSTTGHPSPWMATPFSSPPMATFDMSPYSTTLDLMGGGVNTNPDGSNAGDTQPMSSLFQTQYDRQQQQQQQQQEALQASIMAQAFTKNTGWDVMLAQASSSNHHNI